MLLWWAEFSKTLICLSADGWGWVPSLLVVWPVATQHWSLPGSLVGTLGGLMPRSTSQNFCCQSQCPCPHGEPQPLPRLCRRPSTLAGRSGSVSYGVTASSPGSHCTHYLCVPSKNGVSVSPSPVEVLQSNSASLQSLIL